LKSFALYTYVLLALLGSVLVGCLRDDRFDDDSSLRLQFSKDTLFFDTVFTQFETGTPRSITKQLWVINPHKNAIRTNIRLSGQFPGVFLLNIDGKPGDAAQGQEIRGNDSVMIFVQIFIPPGNTNIPFIVNDQLLFETNGNIQEVQLIGYGQDAHYYRNQVLTGNAGFLIWQNDKPHVIFDSILVPRGTTLIIKEGARIHSFNRSVILVAGTMIVEGSSGLPVVFEGTRTDADYRNRTGQWIGIRYLPGSVNNVMKHAVIRNGILGIEVDSVSANANPNLLLTNTRIENMQAAGVVCYSANVTAINNIISDCGQFTFYGALGGDYTLYHNTFASYNIRFNRQNPHFLLDNTPFKNQQGQILLSIPLNYRLINNVIYGSREEELLFNNAADGNQSFTTRIIQNNFLRTRIDGLNTNNNRINIDPRFENIAESNFKPQQNSPLRAAGIFINVNTDFEGNQRSASTPTVGAWE
jgi:hypothetical protein